MAVLDESGKVLEVRKLLKEEESVEFYDGILVPGFVNSHTHIELSHLLGKFERGSGMAGFIRQINRLRDIVTEEERVEAIAEQMDKSYNEGVSAIADISNHHYSFSVKQNSKIYSRTFIELFGTEENQANSIIESAKELTRKAKEMGLDAAPTPHSCYTLSPKLLELASKEALLEGWLSFHNQESWEEEMMIKFGEGPLAQEYKGRSLSTPPVTGASPLSYFLKILAKSGELSNQNILLVHNTSSTVDDFIEASEAIKNLYWALSPRSNLFIHNILPPVIRMMEEGLNLVLGTDSLSSNSSLSMVEEIKTIQDYFPSIPLERIVEWCTINGARFLGKERLLGSIEPGKSPGIVLIDKIDWERMHLTPESQSRRII